MTPLKIGFDKGTLILQNVPKTIQPNLPDMLWDERTLTFRAPAYRYRHIVIPAASTRHTLHRFCTAIHY